MKDLNIYISEKLHISKFNEEINFNKDVEEDIIEMIFNFCSLFYNVNNFFNYSINRGEFIRYKFIGEIKKKFNEDTILVF